MALYYDEIFTSIQGESTSTGLPTTFVRLFGCDIGCVYCDQPQYEENKKKILPEQLVKKVEELKCKRICITGGEPLAQKEVYSVIYDLVNKGYEVSIETSGCVPILEDPYTRSFRYVMDIKCPSSGVSEKNIFENLLLLQSKDEVKFVVSDRTDYEFFLNTMTKYPTTAKIIISPVITEEDGIYSHKVGSELVQWLIEDKLWDIRIGYQLHKVLSVK